MLINSLSTPGERIRSLRLIKGMTVKQLAVRVGSTPPYLSLIENNARNCSVPILNRICKELDASADYILFGEDDRQKMNRRKMIEIIDEMTEEEMNLLLEYIEARKIIICDTSPWGL